MIVKKKALHALILAIGLIVFLFPQPANANDSQVLFQILPSEIKLEIGEKSEAVLLIQNSQESPITDIKIRLIGDHDAVSISLGDAVNSKGKVDLENHVITIGDEIRAEESFALPIVIENDHNSHLGMKSVRSTICGYHIAFLVDSY